MQALDSITTSQWSNIPPCIIQSINILVELSRSQSANIETLKNNLTDLTLKFSVKTGRYDAKIEEIQGSFKSFNSSTFKEIENCKEKEVSNTNNFQKKLKTLSETLAELKNRVNSISNDLRRDTRDNSNKMEFLRVELSEEIQSAIEKSKLSIKEDFAEFFQKYKLFTQDIEELLGQNKDKIKEMEQSLLNFSKNQAKYEEILSENNTFSQKAREVISKIEYHQQKHKTNLKTLHNKLDTFSRVNRSSSSSESEDSPKTSQIHPLLDKIPQLEEKIGELDKINKNRFDQAELKVSHDLAELHSKIKGWTQAEISVVIEKAMEKVKRKLDWLPNDGDNMKGMTVTEARIFMLESRIREEENSRIIAFQKLENDIALKKIVRNEKFQRNRANFTPVDDKTSKFDNMKGRMLMKKRPNSSLASRESTLKKASLRDKFSLKISDML